MSGLNVMARISTRRTLKRNRKMRRWLTKKRRKRASLSQMATCQYANMTSARMTQMMRIS